MVHQGFYKKSFKKWLDNNEVKMYLIHNEGTAVFAEIFISTIKFFLMCYMMLLNNTVIHIIQPLKLNLLILNPVLMLNKMLMLILKTLTLK